MAIEMQGTPDTRTAPTTGSQRFGLGMQIRFGSAKVSIQQRITFTERLALLLETGVTLLEAIKAMQQQAEDELLERILASLATSISEGKTFSHALARHPEMFPATYVSLVGAAEEGGFLPQVLTQLFRMDEKNSQMRSNMQAALTYPVFLIVFSFAVVLFVLVFIFPKFEALFASIHDQLPVTTLFLMAVSSLVRHHWLVLLVGFAAAAWAAYRWLASPAGRSLLDRAKMSLPLARDIYTQIYLSQTLGVLGLSLSNGVPITVALKACQGAVNNSVFAGFLESLRRQVNEGRGIAIGFASSPLVPHLVRQMVSTGEQTGNLGMVMTRIAEFYDRELAKRVTVLSKAIEPIMLIVMGAVVGLIVASLILPIFKLSRAVH